MKTFSQMIVGAAAIALWAAWVASPAGAADDLAGLLVKKGTITKEEAEGLQTRGIASWVDKITLFGDLQLRQETQWFNSDNNDAKNVNRQRFRLRIGTDITEGGTIVHLRFTTGNGSQTSTNQTMQSLSTERGLLIDRAYAEYVRMPDTALAFGRMANPFFKNFTGEIVFDDDYSPEGIAERHWHALGENGKLFVNLGQFVLDNQNGPGAAAQWLLGYQAGADVQAGGVGVNAAVLYYTLANGTRGSLSQTTVQDGNTRKACTAPCTPVVLANPFNVIDATTAVTFKGALPVTIAAEVVKNLSDTKQTAKIDGEDLGYSVGIKVGDATKGGKPEIGYLYRSLETDATLADLVDSDWAPKGGTNRAGNSIWLAYGITNAAQVKLRYFNNRLKDESLPPGAVAAGEPNPNYNRLQIDLMLRF